MAHKTLIGGTVYNITGGKSMVSGTVYNISSGRTLIDGTGYNISFAPPATIHAVLYNNNTLEFWQNEPQTIGGASVANSWSFVSNQSGLATPWTSYSSSIRSVRAGNTVEISGMIGWFSNAYNLTNFNSTNFVINKITNMYMTFYCCNNLTGSPVCGDRVESMYHAYYNCCALTGSPVCGNNVTNMWGAYHYCSNLTGAPVCGDNVTQMIWAYCNCRNLTGSPVCGNNVTNMYMTYANCHNLSGAPACGSKVKDMERAYEYVNNVFGNAYFYSPNVSNVFRCFIGRKNTRRLNIYVQNGSKTHNTIMKHKNTSTSMTGESISWTNKSGYFYNSKYNIYVYTVDNVSAARIANGD